MVINTKRSWISLYYTQYPSPIGPLLLTADECGLTGLWIHKRPAGETGDPELPVLKMAVCWLDAYFRGEDPVIDFPLHPMGTPFQRKVWEILLTIPYGETRSYGSIAREMAAWAGKKKMSAQAVGQAVGRNPLCIVVPCHRVVGAKGQLTGYTGGMEHKVWLLRHEGWLPADEENEK